MLNLQEQPSSEMGFSSCPLFSFQSCGFWTVVCLFVTFPLGTVCFSTYGSWSPICYFHTFLLVLLLVIYAFKIYKYFILFYICLHVFYLPYHATDNTSVIPFIIVPRTLVNTSDTCILYVSVLTLPPTMALVSNIEESKDKEGKNNKCYISSHVLKRIRQSDLKWKFIMKCIHDQLLHVSID